MGRDLANNEVDVDLKNIRIRENSWIARLAAAKLHADNVAIVLGKTINLHNVSKEDFLRNEKWVKHEVCHIRQFQQYGYISFILKYLWESYRHGYYNNKYEAEARLSESQ